MEDVTLTPQVVARIVLQEQKEAAARTSRSQATRKPIAHRYAPYEKPDRETRQRTKEVDSNNNADLYDECQNFRSSGDKEGQDADTIVTDYSLPGSPATRQPSSQGTPVSLSLTPAKSTPADNLCPAYTSTGTKTHNLYQVCKPRRVPANFPLGSCVATCRQTHDASKVALCPSRIKGLPCLELSTCRRSHTWTFKNAPTCATFLIARCCMRGNLCGFAHNESVLPTSSICEEYSNLGFCEVGGDCNKIHWFGFETSTSVDAASAPGEMQPGAGYDSSVAEAKIVEKRKAQGVAKGTEKAGRRSFTEETWAKDPEDFLASDTKGELALQEDFVPF